MNEPLMRNIFKSIPAIPQEEKHNDYYKDGFLICGNCHTRKETEINVLGEIRRVNCLCKCRAEERDRQYAEDKKRKWLDAAIREGIADREYLKWTMDMDDGKNPEISKAVRNYVENWQEMKAENIGLLFYGNVGTGKTFYAANIANGLLDRGVGVIMTNIPSLMTRMSKGFEEDKAKILHKVSAASMLIIDDIGIERDTPYAFEKIQEIIDTRYRSGKPLIVTTNLSLDEMMSTEDVRYQRIFNRIVEMCCMPIKVVGRSRRVSKAMQKTEKARGILGL